MSSIKSIVVLISFAVISTTISEPSTNFDQNVINRPTVPVPNEVETYGKSPNVPNLYSDTGETSYVDYDTASDTPDPHVSYSDNTDPYTELVNNSQLDDPKITNQLKLTKTLLNGTAEEVRMMDRNYIISMFDGINKIDLSLSKKLAIWDIIKNNNSVGTLSKNDLVRTGKMVLFMPQLDLYSLNYSDWGVIDYLSTIKGLRRRQAGIIGYAIRKVWGHNIHQNITFINKLKGLICAFSPQDLLTFPPERFCEISQQVFENIGSCTIRQLQVLLHLAKLATVHGPTQAWGSADTQKLALLIAALPLRDLKSIRPTAMEGINYQVIEAMSKKQLKAISEDQVSYLNDDSLAAYRRITGLASNHGNVAQIPWLLVYCSTILICNRLVRIVKS